MSSSKIRASVSLELLVGLPRVRKRPEQSTAKRRRERELI